MKNLLKKFGVMIACLMLVMTTFAMPSYAAPEKGTVLKIMNLPKTGVDVKAYKIVKQDAKGNWVSINTDGTTWGTPGTPAIADVSKPSSKEITDLADKTLKESRVKFAVNSGWTAGDTDAAKATQFWSADMKDDNTSNKYGVDDNDGAGMYLVLVSSTATGDGIVKVYNPMIVSLTYDKDGDLAAGSVDTNDKFTTDAETNNVAYAKSSEPTFDKYIIRDKTESGTNDKANHNQSNQELEGTTNVLNDKTDGETEKGDTASRGDIVWFEIATTIPVYAENYKNPTFQIHDELSDGLDLDRSTLKVFVDGKEVAATSGDTKTWKVAYTPTVNVDPLGTGTKTANDKFDITFDSDYLMTAKGVKPAKKVVVRYAAKVRNDCDENFDPETNDAYITYTHKPGENGDKDSEKKRTYHYTFSINGKINGESSTILREVVKVGVNKDGVWIYEETQKADNGWVEDIEGATFNLYKDSQMADDKKSVKANENAYRTAYSAADGRLIGGTYDGNTYTGLDRLDAGVYYLVEQSVPKPYVVKDIPIKVEIKSGLNADGTLDWYSIDIDNVQAGKYKAVYDTNADGSYKLDAEGEPAIKEFKVMKKGESEWKTMKTAAQAVDSTAGNTAPAKPDKAAYDAADDKKIDGKTYEQALNEWFEACKNYFAANDPDVEAADIANTETGTLPSTGGMGTILFTIAGIVVIGLAFLLLFGGKRRKTQNS